MAALYAYDHQQSGSAPEQRISTTPAGRPSGRPEAELPRPDGAVFLAPHPGPGSCPARAAGRVTQSGICQGICGSTRPVSSSVFRLDSTADQPPAAIRRSASSARSSWVTVNRTMSP